MAPYFAVERKGVLLPDKYIRVIALDMADQCTRAIVLGLRGGSNFGSCSAIIMMTQNNVIKERRISCHSTPGDLEEKGLRPTAKGTTFLLALCLLRKSGL